MDFPKASKVLGGNAAPSSQGISYNVAATFRQCKLRGQMPMRIHCQAVGRSNHQSTSTCESFTPARVVTILFLPASIGLRQRLEMASHSLSQLAHLDEGEQGLKLTLIHSSAALALAASKALDILPLPPFDPSQESVASSNATASKARPPLELEGAILPPAPSTPLAIPPAVDNIEAVPTNKSTKGSSKTKDAPRTS
ncbi:hypothetical protein EDC04DRAFT_2610979 [Pisolithus marmoratus]|nr:hypothetical protein EDC04DRAFT_2610979 [Pisolithus marmoratus]